MKFFKNNLFNTLELRIHLEVILLPKQLPRSGVIPEVILIPNQLPRSGLSPAVILLSKQFHKVFASNYFEGTLNMRALVLNP